MESQLLQTRPLPIKIVACIMLAGAGLTIAGATLQSSGLTLLGQVGAAALLGAIASRCGHDLSSEDLTARRKAWATHIKLIGCYILIQGVLIPFMPH